MATKITYDKQNRALYVHLSDLEVIADETIEDNLTLGWASNGKLVDVTINGADPPTLEVVTRV